MKKENRALGVLLLTAAIWGFAFTAQKEGAEVLPPLAIEAWRYLIGAAVLFLISFLIKKKQGTAGRGFPRTDRKAVLPGMLIGTVLFIASTLQQLALSLIGPGKCGFLTALYVVLVPLLGRLFFRRSTGRGTWAALLIAVPALYLLCGEGASFIPTPGDLLAVAGAVFWALHILLTDRLVPGCDLYDLCAVQFLWCGLIALAGTLLTETSSLEDALRVWPQLAYVSFLSTAAGYTLQTVGQRNAKPAHAAIVLSMESVFSVLGGALLLGERFRPAAYAGCVLMLFAVILSQLSAIKGEQAHV